MVRKVGTPRDDTLVGSGQDDTLVGRGGDDRLIGRGGDDKLHGGPGADSIAGYTGNDWLDGGSGDDFLFGGQGNDVLVGGRGDDRLEGGPGLDKLYGGLGQDELRGGIIMVGGPEASKRGEQDGTDIFWDNPDLINHQRSEIRPGGGRDIIFVDTESDTDVFEFHNDSRSDDADHLGLEGGRIGNGWYVHKVTPRNIGDVDHDGKAEFEVGRAVFKHPDGAHVVVHFADDGTNKWYNEAPQIIDRTDHKYDWSTLYDSGPWDAGIIF